MSGSVMMFSSWTTVEVATAIGFVGSALGASWPLARTRTGMLVMQCLIGCCFATHFFMIGAVTGAMMNVFSALQAAAAIPLGERPAFRRVYVLTLPLIFGTLVLTWGGLASAFVATAMAIVSVGRYQLDPLRFRLLMLCSIPFWFSHNLLVGSVPGMVSDVAGALVNATNIVRMIRKRRVGASTTLAAAPSGPVSS